jgi:hypothetical protein
MQINSPQSLRLAARIFDLAGGDWDAVRRASRVRADGVRVIDPSRLAATAGRERR